MNGLDLIFGQDIVLDEEAFDRAAADFASLSGKLESLREEMEGMLQDLKQGFDTPAGDKFLRACQTSLFRPLNDQKLVLDHVSDTLSQARQAYGSVFQRYDALQNTIRSSL